MASKASEIESKPGVGVSRGLSSKGRCKMGKVWEEEEEDALPFCEAGTAGVHVCGLLLLCCVGDLNLLAASMVVVCRCLSFWQKKREVGALDCCRRASKENCTGRDPATALRNILTTVCSAY